MQLEIARSYASGSAAKEQKMKLDSRNEEDGLYSRSNASEDDSTWNKHQEISDARSGAPRGLSRELSALEIPRNIDLLEKLMSENQRGESQSKSRCDNESPTDDPNERMNEHKESKSLQLGKQLSCNWSTGAGPRIGCLRDYPSRLQERALEEVKLSPRSRSVRLDSSSPSESRRGSSNLSCRSSFHSKTQSSPLHSLC